MNNSNIFQAGLLAAILLGGVAFPGTGFESPARTAQDNPLGLDEPYNFSQEELDRFIGWINQAVEQSRRSGSCAIVIDKADYTLHLVGAGELRGSYSVELGFNPIDDKRMEGDGCTPEGIYKVNWIRDIGNTVFYRALMINYPNAEDSAEFARLRQAGAVPAGASAGSDIEIHGSGSGKPGNGGGFNWTLGCIALSNEDIDRVFQVVQHGCLVIIVRYGSRLSGLFSEAGSPGP